MSELTGSSDEWTFVPTAAVHEAAGRAGQLPRAIATMRPGQVLCGPAFTVLCGRRDNLALHHAIAEAPAGAVLVCQTGGHVDAGYVGEVMVRAAMARGLAGLVIDACVRDGAALRESGWPVFARGLCVTGTTKDPLLPQGCGHRLRFDEVDVDPGDLVLGDDDGVVVAEASTARVTLEAARARERLEQQIFSDLAAGRRTVDIYRLPALDS